MIDPRTLGTAGQVLQVKYAERQVRCSDVFHQYERYGLPDATLDMDYNFWVIRDADDITLVDTGYDVPARDWLGEIPVTATPECLRRLGIAPESVTRVITSHFHYDHIGYLGLFTQAEVVSGGPEYDYWFGKRAAGALDGEFTTEEDLAVVEAAEKDGRLRLVRGSERVSDAIAVRPVGGHCPGELLVAVRTADRPLLLASDAAHFYEQIEHEWPFFAFTDLGEMRRALSLITELARDFDATVVPGHDARTRDRFPALPGPASDIAVVLG